MSANSSSSELKAIVIFDSRFGYTEKIANAIELGLRESDVKSACINFKDVKPESLKEYDLIAVGAPTEKIAASKSIKDFFETLNGMSLTGRCGFAFDTRFDSRLAGSAAKFIERKLNELGVEIILPHSSAFVVSAKEEKGGVKLREGEVERFQGIGKQAGALLARTGGKREEAVSH